MHMPGRGVCHAIFHPKAYIEWSSNPNTVSWTGRGWLVEKMKKWISSKMQCLDHEQRSGRVGDANGMFFRGLIFTRKSEQVTKGLILREKSMVNHVETAQNMCSGGGAHMGMLPCSMRRHILPYSEK
jgi:hypothetical protein